jgi:glyoxylase-like metal-dependent hydrolase (beta-lactamase superfamily II)
MAEVLPGVFIVDGVAMAGRPGTVNVCLLVSDGEGTLIDAGFPGVSGPLKATLAQAGIGPEVVRRVIITHHHTDHTGGLAETVRLTGAEVWVHADDAGYIDGSTPHPDPAPAILEMWRAQGRAPRPAPEPVPVARRLSGGEVLGILGGARVLHTPGHTPGHLSLLIPERSLLLAGDMLRFEDGRVVRPPEMFGWDLDVAERSILEVAGLEFDSMLPYHGDFLAHGAAKAVRTDMGIE